MGKMLKKNYLRRGGARRPILAVSLAATLAAFGCTTNLNPGNGAPTRTGPELRTSPTSAPIGSESGTNPPMMSSYTRAEALPAPTARLTRRNPNEAAAIMADRAVLRARYLGVVDPGTTSRGYVSDLTPSNRIDNPALRTNPQLTVNSSISSAPTPAINSGAGAVAGGDVLVTTGTTGAVVLPGTAGATTTTTTAGATLTPTSAALGLPAGTFAAGALTPTAAAALNPAVTAVSGARLRTTTGTTSGVTTTTTGATANATSTTRAGTVLGSASAGVRIIRSNNGSVTMTNVNGQH